jgi:CheY-like chemotaxis protein
VEACGALIDEQGHKLTVTLPSEPILLDADTVRLTQVFSNLLNNAAKYSERGGEIRLSAVLDGGEIVVSIRDNGIGIPAAKLPTIFETFVQVDISWERRQGGMGIGLSLVKEFVGLHGGKVEARSEGPGHGSEFIVRLPVATGVANELTPSPEKTRAPRRRVLIVDDNRDAAESLAMVLKFLGHEAITAYDGEAGLVAAAEYRPDLVVMDLGMPNMDGYEACRRIRAKSWGRDPYLVALSGWGAADDLRRTHDAGFDRHLVKPVDVNMLAKMIADMSS